MEDDALNHNKLYSWASRLIQPLLQWRQTLEAQIVPDISTCLTDVTQNVVSLLVAMVVMTKMTTQAISTKEGDFICEDAVIQHMIQPGSRVEIRMLQIGERRHSAILVFFSRNEVIPRSFFLISLS